VSGPLTLGTAGHIDHGKTALIRGLTGIDTDRLPEEQARGISIALGYARLVLPSGRALSVIDAPGHERFVRTMVAGATGIDLYLMTVAADDGVMPQTREHAAVLRALGIERGLVAITKSDLADPVDAIAAASELLPGASAVVPVSARTGAGLDELRSALDDVVAGLPSRSELGGRARLHIDRVFTVKGAGTVVTGTLWSGEIAPGEVLEILPSGRPARVRGVQVHDESVERAAAGQRVAVNLTGIRVGEVERGDVLAAADAGLRPTYRVDAELSIDAEHGDRVQVHHGTRETPARIAWLGGDFWQVRLEQPLVPAAGDRFVVRQISPPDTLGGGVVLDPHPRRHGPSRELLARLDRLRRGDSTELSASQDQKPRSSGDKPEPAELSASAIALERRLKEAGLEPPLDAELDPGDLAALRAAGRAVRVSRSLHYHPEVLAEIRRRVVEVAGEGGVTISQLRDELRTSRKFAQAILEHLDSEKVTIRRGDAHYVRRAAR
jgi:selenocysteine-specific elongation factor